MKKILICLLTGIFAVSLVGCGADDITLDSRQNDLIAEYIAGEMLKFSYDNEWKYTKVRTALDKYESNGTTYSPIVPTQQATTSVAGNSTTATTKAGTTKSSATSSATGTTASTDIYQALTNALGITGASISVKDCTSGTRYPMEEYAVCISARDGYKVVAVEFNIKNNLSSEMTLNTASSGVTMRIDAGGKDIVQTASMLNNDIIALKDVKVAAGSTYTAVACLQVPESSASGTATLTAYKNGASLGTISNLSIQ